MNCQIEVNLDANGYLTSSEIWSPRIAEILAQKEGLTLSEEHWEVICFLREFYLQFNTSPGMRMLVKAMAEKFGKEKGNSRYLFQLFPEGPASQATRIAGLPKPTRCL